MRATNLWRCLAAVVALGLGGCGTAERPQAEANGASTGKAGARHLVACGSRSADVASTPQQPHLFSPESTWNQPVSANSGVGDAGMAAAFRAEIGREIQTGIGPWIQTTEYSTPLYTVGSAQRCVRVKLDVTATYGRTLRHAFRRVPLPATARPAAGTDGHLTLWQPSTDSLWEFWKLRRESDGWHAAWGGVIRNVSRSPGYFTKAAWPGARSYWGATATSLPAIAGTMLISELQRGEIPHALAVSIPNARAGVYALPARRTDGTLRSPAAIPEGARFRLDPNVDLADIPMPRVVRIMAVAAQRYGLIVRDKTLHATGFYAEDPSQFPGSSPYPRLFEGKLPSVLLKQFPWQHLQALPLQLRRAATR